ncbi:MAG: hypothetical protein R3264_11555 [Anaerolineae bacterium]|nr:hypothetical protein [Anaerolineae bacterium]
MPTRLLAFAGSTVAVTSQGSLAQSMVQFLFNHLPADEAGVSHTTFRLVDDAGAEAVSLHQDEQLLVDGASAVAGAERLLGEVCHQLAVQSRGGLLFHAAAVGKDGWGLMLPGQSGVGKSTLTVWLVTQGFSYLTDELAFIPTGTTTLQAFPRPINLKPVARSVVSQFVDVQAHPQQVWHSRHTTLLLPAALNSDFTFYQPPLHHLVFPHYRPGGEFGLQPLTKAQAGLELMQCLVNARNLPGHGFNEITRLCGQVTAHRLTYSHFSQLASWLEEL